MGHHSHRKAYQNLQRHIDKLPATMPDTPRTRTILRMLFTPEEAALVSRLPLKPRSSWVIARHLGEDHDQLKLRLDKLADRGLILDVYNEKKDRTYYCIAPPVVGFVEFSLMRVRDDIDQPALARTYEEFFDKDRIFGEQLFGGATKIGRAIVHEDALEPDDVSELLTYDRASAIVDEAHELAVGICYCRHKASHLNHACGAPQRNCLSLNRGAEYVIRHHHAERIDKAEAQDLLVQAREHGLVHIADNVKRRVTYICNCCGCCCGQLQAINRYGMEGAVKTSAYMAEIERDKCTGCGRCARRCPVQAIQIQPLPPHIKRKARMYSAVDERICLGCGVCKPACKKKALHMRARPERVITPEATLERMITMALERDRLHHVLFEEIDGPHMVVLNRLMGAIMRLPPVKRALVSEKIKSRFVSYMASGYRGTSDAGRTV